ncbi:hypothetical protein [Amycolatopsis sp. cmx-8-4]|uniref:hypothetical protein n=1 Tax=Amycolatopsis sp. cmx-8-4 TaxID=2790947 RepID=UPI003978FA5D
MWTTSSSPTATSPTARTARIGHAQPHISTPIDAPVEFHGEYHDLRGSLIGPHIEQQPWPCLFNAGVSAAGQELIAGTCDFAFTPLPDDYSKVRKNVDLLAERTEAAGPTPRLRRRSGRTRLELVTR